MTDWVRDGCDVMSSGRNATDGDIGNMTVALISSMGLAATSAVMGAIRTTPLVVGAYVYVTSLDGKFYKLDATTLALVGTALNVGSAIRSTPHVTGGVAYFGADDGYLYAVNTTTMTQTWRSAVQGNGPVKSHPVVSGTRVWYTTDGTNAPTSAHGRAANISDGTQAWSTVLSTTNDDAGNAPSCPGSLALYSGRVHLPAEDGVHVVNATTLAAVTTFGSIGRVETGVCMGTDTAGPTYCVFSGADGRSYCYDADTGQRVWENYQHGDNYARPAIDPVANGNIGYTMLGLHTSWRIQATRMRTGRGVWVRDASPNPAPSGTVRAGFSIVNGTLWAVYVPNDGRLVGFAVHHAPGGQLPLFKYGTSTGVGGLGDAANTGFYSSPALVNGMAYWGAEDGKVRRFA